MVERSYCFTSKFAGLRSVWTPEPGVLSVLSLPPDSNALGTSGESASASNRTLLSSGMAWPFVMASEVERCSFWRTSSIVGLEERTMSVVSETSGRGSLMVCSMLGAEGGARGADFCESPKDHNPTPNNKTPAATAPMTRPLKGIEARGATERMTRASNPAGGSMASESSASRMLISKGVKSPWAWADGLGLCCCSEVMADGCSLGQ